MKKTLKTEGEQWKRREVIILYTALLLCCIVAITLEALNGGETIVLPIISSVLLIIAILFLLFANSVIPRIAVIFVGAFELVEFFINAKYISYTPAIIALLIIPVISVICVCILSKTVCIEVDETSVKCDSYIFSLYSNAFIIPIDKICLVKNGGFDSIEIYCPICALRAIKVKDCDKLYTLLSDIMMQQKQSSPSSPCVE